ncbi:endonuclease III [Candidatus Liberibacter americanus]|uniref:Endonuclease III n=1 Tax=Candidatus Liberibacter americanus str. Sao Paulo TaxID=1261131 RepID=U6B4Z7_9HYPH|nr:endonuclease III [Candidatus Liberibacter americanus]AHA27678.1 endonuclease III [Candidatus Liberibacter americanus str. Sao Paulo]EMS36386.1 endonuclease III [Candidatus Liberibacter americanus PW_SP]
MILSRKTNSIKKEENPRCLYNEAELEQILYRFSLKWPSPKGELDYINHFTLLIAVLLSAQSTDVIVNKATKSLFDIAETPEKMLSLGEEKIRNYIKTIGIYRNKAKNIISLSNILINKFNSKVPQNMEELMILPGIGRKSANVILSMAFGMPTIGVDTHIFRIANRIGLAPGKTPDKVENSLMKIIPKKHIYHAHYWLVLHGRYTCKARQPKCQLCIISDICKQTQFKK